MPAPVKTPEELFEASVAVKNFIAKIHKDLGDGEREIEIPVKYPEDFIKKTQEHIAKSGWNITLNDDDPAKKKFVFVAKPPAPPAPPKKKGWLETLKDL